MLKSENSVFLKKGHNGNLPQKNLKFFLISDDETDLTVEFVSRNLVTQSNFVEF